MKFLVIPILALSIFAAPRSEAIPLVRQTVADFHSDIATIYPDSSDPNLFYFLPNTGSIAKNENGVPLISLTYRGLDQPDGLGFLTAVFEAGITPQLRNELKSFQKKHPQARLTVVPFGRSYFTLGKPASLAPPNSAQALRYAPVAADQNQSMSKVVGDQKPPQDVYVASRANVQSLAGMNEMFKSMFLPPDAGVAETQVGFNAVLTNIGASMFRASLSGLNPLNMFLCFEVYGALPTMEASITMNYERIYEYFQSSSSHGWLWWGWSVAAAVERLRESQDIKITITGADDKMEDYVLEVAKDLAKTYLVPTLSAAPGATQAGTSFAFNQFSFNSTYKEERKQGSWTLRKNKFITDDRCIAMPMGDLKQYEKQISINADQRR